MAEATCPTCYSSFQGNFCPACGQKLLAVPFTFKSLFHYAATLIELDRGFLFTFYSVFFKPATLIHTYLKGGTRRYNNPLRFLVMLATVFVTLDYIRTSGSLEGLRVIYIAPVVVFLSFFTAVFNFIAYKRSWRFAEHVIVSLYFGAATFFIITLPTLVMITLESFDIAPYSDQISLSITLPLLLLYIIWFNRQVFFSSYGRVILKALLYVAALFALLLLVGGAVKVIKSV